MDRLYAPLLVLLTSLLGYLYARSKWGLTYRDAMQALGAGLEFIGCWVLVYAVNLLLGLVLILLIRRVTGLFISVYVLKSLMFTLFTALQALIAYHVWLMVRQR